MLQAITPRASLVEPLLGPNGIRANSAGALGLARRFVNQPIVISLCLYLLVFASLVYLLGPLVSQSGSSYPGVLIAGLAGGIVAALGELIGYMLGTRTSRLAKGGRLYLRFLALMRHRIGPSLFALALLPGPFIFLSLWAGRVRYPVWRFLLYVTAGKVIKLTAFAFVGYHSISWLFQPLG